MPAYRRPDSIAPGTLKSKRIRLRRAVAAAMMVALAPLGTATGQAAADSDQQFGYQRPGATELISVASDGTHGNDWSQNVSISADGRHLAFDSTADNLVPNDTNDARDVFVHDRETGVTERVSVASDGAEADSSSIRATISADGRHVAFESRAGNLVPEQNNECPPGGSIICEDTFVHDRETGITERVSVASDGTPGNHRSGGGNFGPAISGDGRYVAFQSRASNLVPDITNDNTPDVFVHDRETQTTERVSVASDGTEGNGSSVNPTISSDGRYVAFSSRANNLVPDDTNFRSDIFVHDRETQTTERVSVASDGTEANLGAVVPAISADGRHVAFSSLSTNLVPGETRDDHDIFVHDRETGVTDLVSVSSDGSAGRNKPIFPMVPSISADGRYVTFSIHADNFVAGDSSTFDVFVHDRQTGATERVSVAPDGTGGNAHSSVATAALSADGRYVAFWSGATDLVPGHTNTDQDAFVRDRGPQVGVGNLTAIRRGDDLTVSGWGTFSGLSVASADDPEGDGVDPVGAEILGASVTYRPEDEDLLLRLDVKSLPHVALAVGGDALFGATTAAGAPGVLYRWTLTAGETAYEVRALRTAATSDPPTTGPPTEDAYFALYECAASCTEIAPLSGGLGTTGADVRVSVPLGALDIAEGADLTGVEASAAVGEASPGGLVTLDAVELPDAALPISRVELGIAPAAVPEDAVPFEAQADLAEGRFSGTLDASSFASGAYRLWARACLGEVCGASSVVIDL